MTNKAHALGRVIRDRPFVFTVFVVISPILTLAGFIVDPTGAIIAALILILGLASNYPDLKTEYDKAKKQIHLEQRTETFKEKISRFEQRFKSNFVDFENGEFRKNIIDYSWDVFEDEKYRTIFLIYLRDGNKEGMDYYEYSKFVHEISRLQDFFNLENPDPEDLEIAWGVHEVLCTDHHQISLSGYPDSEFLQNSCLQHKFIEKYLKKNQAMTRLTEERDALAEYRETLATLYEDGRLDKWGIKNVLGDLDEHITTVVTDKTHFFILMNILQDEVGGEIVNTLQAEGIEVHDAYMNIDNNGNQGMFSVLIAISEDDMNSPEFYSKYIESIVDNADKEGYLSIHRAEFRGDTIVRDKFRQLSPDANVQKAVDARNVLTSGEEILTISLKDKLIESYLTTNQLLSVLPLNLFLRDLESEKKKRLVEYNEEIKNFAGVETLTDWANPPKTEEEIAEYLTDNIFQNDSVDYWIENITRIQSEAQEVRDAIRDSPN